MKPTKTLFLVAVDVDDEESTTVAEKAARRWFNVKVVKGKPGGKIKAINRGLDDYSWDVVAVVADDMRPYQDWDHVIRKSIDNDLQLVNFNTEPRLGDQWRDLVTLPVMTRRLYNYFGYVYHPDYVSEYCDNEQTEVCSEMGCLKHVDLQPIRHEWISDDKLSQHNVQAGKVDRDTFLRRKAEGFPR